MGADLSEFDQKADHLPDAQQFRRWLKKVLDRLDIKPYALGKASGVSINAVQKFVTGENREMTLSVASAIYAGALDLAEKSEVKLPELIDSELLSEGAV